MNDSSTPLLGARPTLAAVARLAGVSNSTASLAFSGTGPVSDATRERVLEAAKQLNYAGPDPRARSLRRGRSGIVGVVMEERVGDAFRDPIKIALLDGISDEIAAIDAGLLILTDAGETAQRIEDAPMDAVVLVGCSPRLDESVAMLRQRGIPLVAIEGGPSEDVPSIGQDNREATRFAAQHLSELGHRDVAIVALPLTRDRARGPLTAENVSSGSSSTGNERLAGARDVFPTAGGWMTRGSFVEEGRIAGMALLSDPSHRPTAVIAQSDLLAAGVIRAAEELGLEVPGDVSVVGFDGVRVDGLWPYDLTTLVQPAVEKGRAAGHAIVEMLEGRPPHPASFTSEFHRGNTTAAPRPA
ncbi:LacI family DNA-binding transcriptional regulator [Leifsonia shinshuensis]|uniref:LacI family DNA-binding transcriptional regulator n=1 Tax=Leifsonia shinshuensis TaxID=150026 RepID=UPI001F50A992|nr:LacI family DNA-binding transcriptional regulator [Leifsonia shinshuensis]MCI0156725.1 LacI family DNA-binding transcriptional regulator [Leifsonia shinshuensis]